MTRKKSRSTIQDAKRSEAKFSTGPDAMYNQDVTPFSEDFNVLVEEEPKFGTVTDAMYNQDVAPFSEDFDVLVEEMARALPRWTDKIRYDRPAQRAGLLLRTMRNAARLSQNMLGEKTGMKQSDISALETGSGKQGPTFDVVSRIADACGFYLTFATRTPREQPASARSHAAGAASRGLVRTFIVNENGEITEFEGKSPALKGESAVIVDDPAGLTYKLTVEARDAKVAIEEADPAVAEAVREIQTVGA